MGIAGYMLTHGPALKMTEPTLVNPEVHNDDIESTFETTHEDDQLQITATHHWNIDPHMVMDELRSELREDVWVTEEEVLIEREFNYSPSRSSNHGYVGVYVYGVPDVHGFNDGYEYGRTTMGDTTDPWLFTDGDQEEFTVKDGYPQEQHYDFEYVDGELEEDVWYEPHFDHTLGQIDVPTFAYAHHYGYLDDSPSPANQIQDVLVWKHPDAQTLKEYEVEISENTNEVTAD